MVTRTRKASAQTAQPVDFKMAQPSAAHDLGSEPGFMEIAWGVIKTNVPEDWKRKLVAFVAAFAVGYLGGLATMSLVNTLIVTSLLTGSFTAVVLAVIAFIAGIYLTIKAGQSVGMYIVTGNIDRDIERAKNKITSWFASKRPVSA
jgi:hypothetical protein